MQVEQLFKMITPLLRDRDMSSAVAAVAEEQQAAAAAGGDASALSPQFREEQCLLARVPHLMKSDDTDTLLRIFAVAKREFTSGGARRMGFTFPPLVFAALQLARRVYAREQAAEAAAAADGGDGDGGSSGGGDSSNMMPQYSSRKVFHFIIEVITALGTSHPQPALRLFLQAAEATDECGYHAIAYEFVKEALLLYECEISESKAQVNALTAVIGTLLNCKHFPQEDYEALITKVAQYSNKLLKKPDQCRMISLCSHLFWPPKGADGSERYADCDRVLECMQRSLKIASACNTSLFVEILDK